jgi:hypothetical protein
VRGDLRAALSDRSKLGNTAGNLGLFEDARTP